MERKNTGKMYAAFLKEQKDQGVKFFVSGQLKERVETYPSSRVFEFVPVTKFK